MKNFMKAILIQCGWINICPWRHCALSKLYFCSRRFEMHIREIKCPISNMIHLSTYFRYTLKRWDRYLQNFNLMQIMQMPSTRESCLINDWLVTPCPSQVKLRHVQVRNISVPAFVCPSLSVSFCLSLSFSPSVCLSVYLPLSLTHNHAHALYFPIYSPTSLFPLLAFVFTRSRALLRHFPPPM